MRLWRLMILMEMMLEVVIGVLVMQVDKVADEVTNMYVVVFGSGSVLLDPLSLDPLSWALLLFVFCCCFFSRPIVVGSVVFPALCTCICVLV